jgi:hypothetical protein
VTPTLTLKNAPLSRVPGDCGQTQWTRVLTLRTSRDLGQVPDSPHFTKIKSLKESSPRAGQLRGDYRVAEGAPPERV